MSPGRCPATSSRPAPLRSSMASRQRPTGTNDLRTRLSTVAVVSVKSVQQDVQQQGRTTARMHDHRQRPLAAVVVPTWHAPGFASRWLAALGLCWPRPLCQDQVRRPVKPHQYEWKGYGKGCIFLRGRPFPGVSVMR